MSGDVNLDADRDLVDDGCYGEGIDGVAGEEGVSRCRRLSVE